MKKNQKPSKVNNSNRWLQTVVMLLKKHSFLSSLFVCAITLPGGRIMCRFFPNLLVPLPIYFSGMIYAYYLTWVTKK